MRVKGISIRAPREGGDPVTCISTIVRWIFQSAPPARGAKNYRGEDIECIVGFQSAPPARGATTIPPFFPARKVFQSAPPARGATSILLEPLRALLNFNPRPPRGGRHIADDPDPTKAKFQSAPPARGATCGALFWRMVKSDISIRAPREGGDHRRS